MSKIVEIMDNVRKSHNDLAFWLNSREVWTGHINNAETATGRLTNTAWWQDHMKRCYDGWLNADENVSYYQEQAEMFVQQLTETIGNAIDADVLLVITRDTKAGE